MIRKSSALEEDLWAPVADLMAVIMLVFMLIVMVLFIGYSVEKHSHVERCDRIRTALREEFENDFEEWGAVLEEDLTILFTNQSVLFDVAKADIRPGFARMLADFFPRYMDIVQPMGKEILQIRIDGHTSSEYGDYGSDRAYMENMELSQDRARNILGYVLSLPESGRYKKFAHDNITANGLSSSDLVKDNSGKEIKEASRRVEFKLLANSCQKAWGYDGFSSI